MTKFIIGFVLGIVVSSVGISGIAKIIDHNIEKVKEVSKEQSQ